jgi:SanA protein
MKRRLVKLLLLCLAISTLGILVANRTIRRAARGRTYSDVHAIPHRTVGLVLGCQKYLADNRLNLFFQNRVAAAAELYREGKVDYLLVSGDNHTRGYDEPTDMKNALIEQGVPAEKIYLDYAGFRTLDSVVRAREVFGLTEVTIISQSFHAQRAIFIANHRGLDAIAFNAPDVNAYDSFGTRVREHFARLKAVLDIYVLRKQPHFLGEEVAIGPESPASTRLLESNSILG